MLLMRGVSFNVNETMRADEAQGHFGSIRTAKRKETAVVNNIAQKSLHLCTYSD
jgi:hypothetical protein